MTKNRILLSADTPCDIGPELTARYNVSLFPLHIVIGESSYTDNLDIHPQDLYELWYNEHILPHTAAINPAEYIRYFQPFIDDGCDILHISLGSGLSSSYHNSKIAAESFPGRVYVIDSCSLSTGFGHLVCEAGERIAKGMPISQVYEETLQLVPRTRASFVLDTLEFLHAGGRCSGLAQISADVLGLKPTILVRNDLQGSMVVGKKYIGKLDKSLLKYVDDQLKNRDDIVLDRVFITSSTIDPDVEKAIVARVLALQPFKEVYTTRASCTIGAHCGPNTLGVLFMVK